MVNGGSRTADGVRGFSSRSLAWRTLARRPSSAIRVSRLLTVRRPQLTGSMIDRIQEFFDRLQIDTSRASLGVWIAAINVAVVLLVVGGISISAIGSLRDLADQQGQSRVQLAGAMAREDVRRVGEDTLTQAKSVAERQTLQRLLAGRQTAAVGPYPAPLVQQRHDCGMRGF